MSLSDEREAELRGCGDEICLIQKGLAEGTCDLINDIRLTQISESCLQTYE
jgi:hypothetical protein